MANRDLASAEQVMRFMNGETLRDHIELAERTEDNVAEMTRIAQFIARGTRQELVAALKEVLQTNPELGESPVIKQLEAEAHPKHVNTPLLDACLEADVPAYLFGEASSGKTKAAEIAAASRGLPFRAISMSPTGTDSRFLGFINVRGVYQPTGFRQIWEDGGVFLFDEVDNGNPGSLVVMNRALSGFENEFPDKAVERNWKTRVVAAANTIGRGATAQYVGRNTLDAATIDRFAFIPWDIDPRLEEILMRVRQDEDEKLVDIDRGGVPSPEEWLQEVRDYRQRAQATGLRAIISTRSSIYGRKLAEVGVGVHWLSEMLIFKGMSQSDRQKLTLGH